MKKLSLSLVLIAVFTIFANLSFGQQYDGHIAINFFNSDKDSILSTSYVYYDVNHDKPGNYIVEHIERAYHITGDTYTYDENYVKPYINITDTLNITLDTIKKWFDGQGNKKYIPYVGGSGVTLYDVIDDSNIVVLRDSVNNNYYVDMRFHFSEYLSKVASVKENKISNFKVYPNPVVNELNVNFTTDSFKPVKVTVYSASGRVVYSKMSNSNVKVNMYGLDSGLYFVKIGNQIKKVIKQ